VGRRLVAFRQTLQRCQRYELRVEVLTPRVPRVPASPGHEGSVTLRVVKTGELDSVSQEALCRHLTISDVYLVAKRTGHFIQLLSEDIDMQGIDLSLVYEGSMTPVQLKSLVGSTQQWKVRRRIPIPSLGNPGHTELFDVQDVATEGLDGALLVQELHFRGEEAKVWYRAGRMELIYLRKESRFDQIAKKSQECPSHLILRMTDLTPPLTMGDVTWLLLGFGSALAEQHGLINPMTALIGMDDHGAMARSALKKFEKLAFTRYQKWRKAWK
jgi:hypothetical protein